MSFSKFNYFLILVAIVTSVENLIYFNISNIFQIIIYVALVVLPIVFFIKNVYKQNIRVLDNQVPKIIYVVIEVLLIFLLVAQFTYLIDTFAWLITGNPAAINNVSNFGVWFVAIVFLICSENLKNTRMMIKVISIFLGFFNLIIIPLVLLYLISSTYSGLLNVQLIGHVDATFKQFIQLLPLLSVLLIARSKPQEEKKISEMLLPAIGWMIFIFIMTIICITVLTTSDVASANNYLFDFFEMLKESRGLNIYNYDLTTVLALYEFMNSALIILLIVHIKNKVNKKSFIYARQSEYLQMEDSKQVYINRKRIQTLVIFGLIMAVVVPLSSTLYHLNVLVSQVSTVSIIVLNMLCITLMGNAILNDKNSSNSLKLQGLYTAVMSIIILILFIVL